MYLKNAFRVLTNEVHKEDKKNPVHLNRYRKAVCEILDSNRINS